MAAGTINGHGSVPSLGLIVPIVELDRKRRIFCHHLQGQRANGRITAMAIDNQNAAKACARHAFNQVTRHRQKGFHLERNTAREGREIGRKTKGHGGIDWNTKRLRCLHSNFLGQDRIHTKRKLRMLLRTAKGQYAAIIMAEVSLHLHPVHIRDAHDAGLRA